MKKALITFFAILAGLWFVLSAVDYKSDYVAEKHLWKINQSFQQYSMDPEAVPTMTYDKLAQEYKKFIERFPDSRLTPVAHLLYGRVQVLKKDYPKARKKFESIIKLYPERPEVGVEATAEIGRTYALEKDGANLLSTYERVIKEYPLTELGLRTPVLIAQFYAAQGRNELATQSFNQAVQYYKDLSQQYPNSQVEYRALRYTANTHLAQNQWEDAVNILAEVLMKFSSPEYLDLPRINNIIKSINLISIVKIEDYDLPIGIYQQFMKQHPEHPLNSVLQELVKNLEDLKLKNSGVISN